MRFKPSEILAIGLALLFSAVMIGLVMAPGATHAIAVSLLKFAQAPGGLLAIIIVAAAGATVCLLTPLILRRNRNKER